jgi:hypothetical protein
VIPRLINVALGTWLMFAPAVLGYSTTAAVPDGVDRTIGPLVISAAIAAIWPEIRPLRWMNVVLGALLAIAPLILAWFVDYPPAAVVNGIVVGVAIAAAARVRGPVDARFGGGWRSVWRPDIDTTGPPAR